MTAEYNSSEEEHNAGTEDYSWYQPEDGQSYFCLCTKHKNIIGKDL